MSEDGRIHFTYWSDPLCVWAFVAQPKLDRMLEEFGELLGVRYRIVPVFGSLPHRFSRGPWADQGPKGRAEATREICAQFGIEVSGLVWTQDTPASSWAPALAIEAVFELEERGEYPTGFGARPISEGFREAFFLQDRNTARRSVQLEVAEQSGLPLAHLESALDDGSALARLWEDHHARERGHVRGSPTYVFDEGRERSSTATSPRASSTRPSRSCGAGCSRAVRSAEPKK